MKKVLHWLVVAIAVLLPVSVVAQGQQWLQYQSSNNMLAVAEDVSTENPEADSERQGSDHAVGITGLFFIVVVVTIGVLFAIVMVSGHGKRRYP